MLLVERSNRTERLLAGLAGRTMAPGRDPLAPAIVVVQGPGMERWIAQSIARAFGVCANTTFPFPRDFLERVFASAPAEASVPANPAWEPRRLVWAVASELDAARDDPEFAPLHRHLHAADGEWRLVSLAERLARLFDQYVTFRPAWVTRWAAPDAAPTRPDERWQAKLFRAVHARVGPGHVADRAHAFQRWIGSVPPATAAAALLRVLPGPIEVFAVSTLPPLHLEVIDAVARVRDVHLSMLTPSSHYWADLWLEVREATERGATDGAASLFGPSPPSPIVALLTGLGRIGGDFQRVLEDKAQVQESDRDLFEDPAGTSRRSGRTATLLERLQSRLASLDLDAGPEAGMPSDSGSDEEASASARVVARADDSIRVHLCHGPRRELEVVQSILRDAFERDATLAPEDVIVMAPDIDAIAADVEAVFGAAEEGHAVIPYRIADRGAFRRSPVAEAFRDGLELLGSRATRGELLDWLGRAPVRMRFGLGEQDVEGLEAWAERAGVRFGLDADHRADLELEAAAAHTWSDGLDRLALAHAVGGAGVVFAGRLAEPLEAMGDPRVLGALGDAWSLLARARRDVATKRSVPEWCAWLQALLDASIWRDDANAHEHAAVREALIELTRASEQAGFEARIPFEAIRERVADTLAARPSPQAFLAGGVTFCELVPLRAIPFRIVVVLGLVDGAFPRGRPAPGFDLMGREPPLPGDRTPRSDDRYLFLEAILSARDQLVLTVPGMDLRDGARLPPSVVVSELLDALDAAFTLEGGDPRSSAMRLRDWLVVPHPLQAVSERYFAQDGDPRLVARDPDAWRGARARRAALETEGLAPRRFFEGPLAPRREPGALVADGGRPATATAEVETLSLDDLCQRLARSTRVFLRERLGVRLPRPEEATDELDPRAVEGLGRHALGSALLSDLAAGASPASARARLLAHPLLPAGLAGRLVADALLREAEALVRVARAEQGDAPRPDLPFELEVAPVGAEGAAHPPVRLVGRLDGLWSSARVEIGYARLAGRNELELWIRHLVLCRLAAERDRGLPRRSVLVGRPEKRERPERMVRFGPVEDAAERLARLVAWVRDAESRPLPFFPASSRLFASYAMKGDLAQARRSAHQEFEGGEDPSGRRPESERELDFVRVWEGLEPLSSRSEAATIDPDFERLAVAIFEPLLEARELVSA
ncbi:MAG: exodeoxyribonuclease V subunit gamma [Spirochaetaceae bacterium]|nr:exodeoxyribonuclease V subunit gamma [Spirochaetaceae bacterium]